MINRALLRILAYVLPHCVYHRNRPATYAGWTVYFCDDCYAQLQDNPFVSQSEELEYADDLRALVEDAGNDSSS